ncbi:MAG: N-formylglutamate amidohydrolase [Rhizobiaceae bacterium]
MNESFFGLPVSEVLEPSKLTSPLVFNSPHSGRHYPAEFMRQTRLDRVLVRKSEDMHVEQLFALALRAGAPLHFANFPRAYVDANREPFELDPRMFSGDLPAQANIGSARVAGGLGTIPRIVGEGIEIYDHRLPIEEALNRIEHVYKPFHRSLRLLLNRAYKTFGKAVLIDCHSMPSSVRPAGYSMSPDIIVGDRFGMSADIDIIETAVSCLRSQGFSVVRNKPYAGGFITEHYGRPLRGYHALQIEVNRSLYMNEETQTLISGFTSVQDSLGRFALAFADAIEDNPEQLPLAAE